MERLYTTTSYQTTKLVTSAVTVCLHVFLRGQDMFLEHIWQMFNRMKLPIWPNPNKLIPLQKTSKTSFSKSIKNSIKTFSPLLFFKSNQIPKMPLYLSKSHMAPFPNKNSKLFAYISFVIFVSPFVHVWPIFLLPSGLMPLSHLGERQTGETKKTHRNRRFEVSFGSHGDPISEGDLLHQGCPWWRVPLVPFR